MNKEISYLMDYDGPVMHIMEVCGTHTSQISKNGIRDLLSPKIQLISGPGCPVCVTVTQYLDKCIELAKVPGNILVSFGDMLRVPGSKGSLRDAQAEGASVRMVYSPLDVLKLARKEPEKSFIFAAVGFETTTPVYALLIQEILAQRIKNIKLLTSLKVMPPVIDWICQQGGKVDGFLAPGHVSVITGSIPYQEFAEKYHLPFVIAGFEGEELVHAIYVLVHLRATSKVVNMYPSVVTEKGNVIAQEVVEKFFKVGDASWRGMGNIPASGMYLKEEFQAFDAGSMNLMQDKKINIMCKCAEVLTGRISSEECPLFGKICTIDNPQGACMVSMEGSCYSRFCYRKKEG